MKTPKLFLKKYFLASLFLAGLVFGSCTSSKQMLRKGQYDRAIDKSVNKLRKNSGNQKEIPVLDEAYRKAMDQDSTRIIFLKKEGRPENWDEIFNIYTGMKERQDKVKPLPKLRITDKNFVTRKVIDFNFRSFDEELIQAKQKAADYYYAHGQQLLAKNGLRNARDAYYEFLKTKEFYPNYKDVDELIKQAKAKGTSRVLLKIKNETRVVIPKDLEEDLLKISPAGMEDKWIQYYTSQVDGIGYDFYVLLNLKFIEVTPESLKETKYTESREVQNGWQYVKDSRGNVMKDSLGNDIKVPKMELISCDVIESLQRKTARITANMDFFNVVTNSVIKSFPLIADSKFENYAVVPFGNLDALKAETRKKLGGKPLPFPNDLDMIYKSGEELKRLAKDIAVNNDALLK